MNEYTINEVIEYAKDLQKEFKNKDNLYEFNQAIMRLSEAAENLYVIDSFDEIGKDNDSK